MTDELPPIPNNAGELFEAIDHPRLTKGEEKMARRIARRALRNKGSDSIKTPWPSVFSRTMTDDVWTPEVFARANALLFEQTKGDVKVAFHPEAHLHTRIIRPEPKTPPIS